MNPISPEYAVCKEQIERAKEIDLLSYMQQYEPQELKRTGPHEHCTVTHDSLKISNGKWHWFSRGIDGKSALDYLIKVRDMDFLEAVSPLYELTGNSSHTLNPHSLSFICKSFKTLIRLAPISTRSWISSPFTDF